MVRSLISEGIEINEVELRVGKAVFKSVLGRMAEVLSFSEKKGPKETLSQDGTRLWLEFDFLMSLAEGPSCPSAIARYPYHY